MHTNKSVADDADLEIGAGPIARNIFKGKLSERQVYRLAARGDWPFFRILGKIAGRPSEFRAKMERLERAGEAA